MRVLNRSPWIDLRRSGSAMWQVLHFGLWLLSRRLSGSPASMREIGARLRRICERLGVTYAKLGQFLAIRPDILHQDIASELSKLFDAVPPVEDSEIRAVIEEELGNKREALFATFDTTCLAAASIAQVHRATLHTGEAVAVKVQRPLVREKFAADIRFFRAVAWAFDRIVPLGAISLNQGLEQFERFTVREMDFTEEARTCERVRRNAGPFESAPRPFWRFTRTRILTMELERGVPLSTVIRLVEQHDQAELERLLPGLPTTTIVRHMANGSFRQIFDDGFFHADPHPGNIFVRRDGTAVFLDFGIYGHLTAWELDTLSHFVAAAAVGNTDACLHYFSKLLIIREGTDVAHLNKDLRAVIGRWQAAVSDLAVAPEERHFGRYVNEFFAAVRRHRTGMSLESLLFWRALITLNGTALRVDPNTDVLQLLGKFFSTRRFAMFERRVSPRGIALASQDTLRLSAAGDRRAPIWCEMQMDNTKRLHANHSAKFGAAILAGVGVLLLLAVAR